MIVEVRGLFKIRVHHEIVRLTSWKDVSSTHRKKPPLQGQLRLSCGGNNKSDGQFDQLAWANVKGLHGFDAGRC